MSYPEPHYLGNKGEINAVYHPADSEPDLAIGSSSAIRYLATGKSTRGHHGLCRWDFGPHPSGPKPHFHRTMSESFFILSGQVQLFNGERWIKTREGDFFICA